MRLRSFTAGLLALLVLGIALVCPATYYYHIYEALQTTTGEALGGASYYIYVAGTTTETTIYSDRSGTSTTQPQTTDSDGMVDCYVIAGTYDIAYTHTGWNLSGTFQDFTYGVADSIGNQSVVVGDTLKPQTGTAIYVRAADGQNDADLNVYDVSASNDVGGVSADFTTVEGDTFKAGSGTSVYVRAANGQDDANLNVYDITATGTITGTISDVDRTIHTFGIAGRSNKTTTSLNLPYDDWRTGTAGVLALAQCQMEPGRAGSVTGVYVWLNVDKFDAPADTVTISALKDDVIIFSASLAVAATGMLHVRGLQAAGVDTFNPASLLHLRFTANDTLTYDGLMARLELTH